MPGGGTARFGSSGTAVPRAPQTPRLPPIQRVEAPENRPLKGPAVDLPPDEEDLRQERWQNFRATRRAASYPEFICFEWLENRKGLIENVDFVFQYPLFGGKTQFGGFVLDFFFAGKQMAWFVQGLQFHYVDPKDRARDKLAKLMVSSRGVHVVELFEDDLLQRDEYTLRSAWEGRQVSRNQD